MSKLPRILLVVGCAAALGACSQSGSSTQAKNKPLKTDPQKLGYAVGYQMGQSMGKVGDMIDIPAVEEGLEDGASGAKPKLSAEEQQEIKTSMAHKIRDKQMADRADAAKTNETASEKFLAEKAKEAGVKTTPSGLEYKVDRPGKGEAPKPDDKVTVNYKGSLIDGTVFDSSYKRGKPLTFAVKDVIPGWVEGLQLMKPGSKYTFYIPAKLAYGANGAGDKIGPNQALVFDVELLKVTRGGTSDQPASAASTAGAD